MKKQYLDYILGMGVIICIWAAAFLSSNKVKKNQRNELEKQFLQTQKVFRVTQKLRYDRLVESAYLLAENSTFKANLELGDPATVEYSVNEFSRFMKIDIFIVVGQNDKIMAKMGMPEKDSTNFAQFAEVKKALKGKEPDVDISWPDLKMINNQLYHIVSVPVYAGKNKIIGTILLGTKFSHSEINELKNGNSFDVNFIHDNKLIESSAQNPHQNKELLHFFNQSFESKSLEIDNSNPYTLIEGPAKSQHVMAFISPMGKGEEAYYMCSLPQEIAMNFPQAFTKYSYLFAGFMSLGVILVCFNKRNTFRKVIKK